MPCIELDLLIAFVNRQDRLHKKADELFLKVSRAELKDIYVASSAYLEYELVHRAKGLQEGEIREDLEAFSQYRNLGEAPLTAKTLARAIELRMQHGLTYFDSLHAATAILNDGIIIGTDKAYDNIRGLRRIEAQDL